MLQKVMDDSGRVSRKEIGVKVKRKEREEREESEAGEERKSILTGRKSPECIS